MSALTKYSGIWAGYKGYYDTMERVQEVKQKRGELQALNEQSESCREGFIGGEGCPLNKEQSIYAAYS